MSARVHSGSGTGTALWQWMSTGETKSRTVEYIGPTCQNVEATLIPSRPSHLDSPTSNVAGLAVDRGCSGRSEGEVSVVVSALLVCSAVCEAAQSVCDDRSMLHSLITNVRYHDEFGCRTAPLSGSAALFADGFAVIAGAVVVEDVRAW